MMRTFDPLPVALKEVIFRLPRADHVPKDFFLFDLGDPAWYVLYGYYVVDVRIMELDFVLTHPDYPSTVWAHVRPDGISILTNCSTETFDFQPLPADVLSGCMLCNQEVWIDLPIGHALTYDDDVFADLSKAMRWTRPHRPRKRHRTTDLRRFIESGKRFIASTHRKPVDQMDFPKYRVRDRKIYWRRK